MKKLRTYLLKLNKKYIFLLGVLFFTLSCNKNNTERNEVLVSVVKKEKLDRNSLLITLLFKNKSNKNYVMPVYPEYNLVKSMKFKKLSLCKYINHTAEVAISQNK